MFIITPQQNNCGILFQVQLVFRFRNGNLRARKITLVKPKEPKFYQGVVCSMKNQFGFIERSDVVKEIFFHYSEYNGNIDDIELGDDVKFKVTHRNVSPFTTQFALSGGILFSE